MNSRSLFTPNSSNKNGVHPSGSAYELPRWRTPSPMTASIIPPPIVRSTYSSPMQAPAQSIIVQKPSPSADQQSDLEADLQFLLDAQAEGLIRGYYGETPGDQISTGSTTPTLKSAWGSSVYRAERPVRKKPGLRSARRGIYNRMVALSAVKQNELQEIDTDLNEKDQTLEQIEQWEKKREGLQTASSQATLDDNSVRVQRLQEKADELQEKINRAELQLADMKSTHRKLAKQISAVENAVEAKVASYAASLRMLDDEIHRFLSASPDKPSSSRANIEAEACLWNLPPQRRTLAMAREYWNSEREATLEQRLTVDHEKAALDEASPIWKEVCTSINTFEKQLQIEMKKLSDQSSQSDTAAWEESSLQTQDRTQGLKEILEHTDSLIETLNSRFALAQDRQWNLMIAAIGAELDALTTGKTMLEQMLADHGVQDDDLIATTTQSTSIDNELGDIHLADNNSEIAARPANESHVADTDDDPDPELMFSQTAGEQD